MGMVIRKAPDIGWSEVTPKHVYLNRRRFLAGLPLAGVLASKAFAGGSLGNVVKSPLSTTGEQVTPFKYVSTYNNYYEFGTSKDEPSRNAHTLKTSPWPVKVEGAVEKAHVFDISEILKMAPLEERIYRHRCVEAWSIVVPWIGFSLSELIKRVNPTAKAKYVAFETLWDTRQMPLARPGMAGIDFPYVEGLRMDEAMHPLALLCVGMYGEPLPNQDGAPVRIVVPWKYGFKSIKSIVKIRFVEKQPSTTWNISNSREYGFYSNVNPAVDHPRWSQATEHRLPNLFSRIKTLPFNGYGDQVASLYAGMDLRKNY
jgi:methionine sulfoxide reductase catalytic subunit